MIDVGPPPQLYIPARPALVRAHQGDLDALKRLERERGIKAMLPGTVPVIAGFGAAAPTYRYIRLTAITNHGDGSNTSIAILNYSDDGGSTLYPSTMTSNSAPSPLVSSSSGDFSSSFQAWCAFDRTTGQYWIGPGTTNRWIKIDLGAGNGIAPNWFRIQAQPSQADRLPNNTIIEGSNDDSTWETLWTGNPAEVTTLQTFDF